MNVKRLFIGIKPDIYCIEFIQNWQKLNKHKFNDTFIDKENLHLTLIAPFQLKEENVHKLIIKIWKLIREVKAFSMFLNKIEFGPNQLDPNLIWFKGKTNQNLINLKNLLREINPEKFYEKFIPHITLARFNKKQYNIFRIKNLKENHELNLVVKNVCLYESIRTEKGSKYVIIKGFKLN